MSATTHGHFCYTSPMTFEEAVEELSFHAGANSHLDPRWAAGFMQTLRPFRGTLDTAAMNLISSEDQVVLGKWIDDLAMRISFLFAGGFEEGLGETNS